MKFLRLRKAEEQIHKVPFEAENAAECAKQLVKNFELYNHFSSEVSLGDMIETKDGNRFVVQDVMDFADKYEKEMKKESAITQPNKPKPTTMLPDNMQWAWDPDAADWVAVLKDNNNTTPPLYDPNNQNVVNQTTNYMSTVKSSCLSQFLDGPRYSKEIKIEAGLIKDGLVKYAGFDFNRGTKYAITTKGLEVLRRSSEAEHNEALNEREKLAYMFGFNTDEISTLDTTGKVLKQATSKKWTICEADGTELGEVEADSELDAKVKFGIEHPEYADSQSISAKEIKATINIEEANKWLSKTKPMLIRLEKYGLKDSEEYKELEKNIKYVENLISNNKKDAKYEETTETHEPYPNPSETPHDDIVLENHDGWVNTADKHQYTEEEKRLLPLFKLTNDYIAKGKIENISDLVEEDNVNMFIGEASIINELEHKVKDLGFYCESIEQANTTSQGLVYALKIFLK